MKHTSINIEDVIAWQKAEIEKGRDGTNIPQRFNKKLGLYRFFQTNDIIKLAERSKITAKPVKYIVPGICDRDTE